MNLSLQLLDGEDNSSLNISPTVTKDERYIVLFHQMQEILKPVPKSDNSEFHNLLKYKKIFGDFSNKNYLTHTLLSLILDYQEYL